MRLEDLVSIKFFKSILFLYFFNSGVFIKPHMKLFSKNFFFIYTKCTCTCIHTYTDVRLKLFMELCFANN